MDNACPILGGLFIVLIAVTFIGHGIWVLFREAIKALKPVTVTPCPRCAAPLAGDHCQLCGWTNASLDSLNLRHQVQRLFEQGLISEQARDEVLAAMSGQAGPRTIAPPPLPPPMPVIPVAEPSPRQDGFVAEVEDGEGGAPAAAPTTVVIPPPPVVPPAMPVPPISPVAPVPPRRAPIPPRVIVPPPLAPTAPPKPRRPLAQVLASFMEQRNIRWGELIGGLLIIGCSIALVVSLWSQIAERPILKFSLFTGVTAALLGVGLYTEHRWKLPTTSRGVLLIGTLLVPLNFLAMAAFAQSVDGSTTLLSQGASAALFLWLLWMGSRVLAPAWPGLMTAAVLAPPLTLLLLPYLPQGVFARVAIPVSVYLLTTAGMLRKARRSDVFISQDAGAVLMMLGVATFAALLPVWLFVYKAGAVAATFRALSPIISVGGVPALCAGLLLWRRLAGARAQSDDENSRELAALRTAGTAIAVAGAILMLGGVALGWPMPAAMAGVAGIDAIVLAVIAILYEIPAANLLSGLSLMTAVLVGYHAVAGSVAWTNDNDGALLVAIAGRASAIVFTALFSAMLAGAEVMRRMGRRADAAWWAADAGVAAIAGLALTSAYAYGNATGMPHAGWIYAFYAVAATAMTWRLNWRPGTAVAASLFVLALQQWVGAWDLAMLIVGTIAAIKMLWFARAKGPWSAWVTPLRLTVLAASSAALALLIFQISLQTAGPIAPKVMWAAGLWAIVALAQSSRPWFIACQALVAFAVELGIVGRLAGQTWFTTSPDPWSHPWTLQAMSLGAAIMALAWCAMRWIVVVRASAGPTRTARPVPALFAPRWHFGHVLAIEAALVLLGLAWMALWPGIQAEFATAVAVEAPLPDAHAHAAEYGSWILLAAMAVLCVVEMGQGWALWNLGALAVVLAIASPLAAARWEPQRAAASAWRWYASGLFLIASIPVWLRERFWRSRWDEATGRALRVGLVLMTAAPVLALTLYAASSALAGQPVLGPEPDSLFGRMGDSVSYAIPLLLVAAALLGHAIRDRSSGYAFAASIVANLIVSLGYLMSVRATGFGRVEGIRLLQLNGLALATSGLIWIIIRKRLASKDPATQPPAPEPAMLVVLLAMAVAINAIVILPAAGFLFVTPVDHHFDLLECGGLIGWACLGMTAAALMVRSRPKAGSMGVVMALLLTLPAMVAFSSCWFTVRGADDSIPLRVALVGYVAIAWGMLAIGRWMIRRWPVPVAAAPMPALAGPPAKNILDYLRPSRASGDRKHWFARRATAIGWAAVVIAVRDAFGDPGSPLWSVGAVLAIALLATTLACWQILRRHLYRAGALINLATLMYALMQNADWARRTLTDLVAVNVAGLAIPALAWLVLEMQVFRKAQQPAGTLDWKPFHHVAAIVSGAAVLWITAMGLGFDAAGAISRNSAWLAWGALASAGALMIGCLWDASASYALGGVYALGFALVGLTVHQYHLDARNMLWLGTIVLGCWTLASSYAFAMRARIGPWLRRMGIPRRSDAAAMFVIPANAVLGAAVIVFAGGIDLNFADVSSRLPAAAAALAQALALALLAQPKSKNSGSPPDAAQSPSMLHAGALWTGVAGMILVAWALLPLDAPLLDRVVVAMTVLAGMIGIYGILFTKMIRPQSAWNAASRSMLLPMGALTLLCVLFVLGDEISMRASGAALHIATASVIAVAASLLGLAASAIALAMLPGKDPLNLSDRGRTAYVYVAEALLAITFAHVRIARPEWFGGFFLRYWPLGVMALAFGGAGLGEWFRRKHKAVLAEPLHHTGAFLPVIPALGYWVASSQVDYSVLLVTAGVLYGLLAATRRSFGFGLLAALAGNGALWSVLRQTQGCGLDAHPQMYLIPAALSALAAAQLNRRHLLESQMMAVRYASLLAIYLSSTADLFINGVARAPWLAAVLAGLSVAGVFTGIMLRIRSFLFMGTGFLTLALATIVYHASVDLRQTWLIWVCGIALGLAIIVLFAIIEKHRAKVLALVEKLKEWQG